MNNRERYTTLKRYGWFVVVIAIIVIIVVVVGGWVAARRSNAAAERAREEAMLASLRVGESREELYRQARLHGVTALLGITPVFGPNGQPVNDIAFPTPWPAHPHPPIVMQFLVDDTLFLFREDTIDVLFDAQDRVSHWHRTVYHTGA